MDFPCTQRICGSSDEEPDPNEPREHVGELEIDGIRHQIFTGENRIGRDGSKCSIVIDKPTVSMEHVSIDIERNGEAEIIDLGSVNKTRVGKKILKPHIRYDLEDGAEIMIADVKAKFVIGVLASETPMPTARHQFNNLAVPMVIPESPEPDGDSSDATDSFLGDSPKASPRTADSVSFLPAHQTHDLATSPGCDDSDASPSLLTEEGQEVDIYDQPTQRYVQGMNHVEIDEALIENKTICIASTESNVPKEKVHIGEEEDSDIYNQPTQRYVKGMNSMEKEEVSLGKETICNANLVANFSEEEVHSGSTLASGLGENDEDSDIYDQPTQRYVKGMNNVGEEKALIENKTIAIASTENNVPKEKVRFENEEDLDIYDQPTQRYVKGMNNMEKEEVSNFSKEEVHSVSTLASGLGENEEDSDIYDQPTQRYVKGMNNVGEEKALIENKTIAIASTENNVPKEKVRFENEEDLDIYDQPTQRYVKGMNNMEKEEVSNFSKEEVHSVSTLASGLGENEEDSDIYDQPTQRYVKGMNNVGEEKALIENKTIAIASTENNVPKEKVRFENEEDLDIYDQPTQRYVKGINKVEKEEDLIKNNTICQAIIDSKVLKEKVPFENMEDSDIYDQPTQRYVKGMKNADKEEVPLGDKTNGIKITENKVPKEKVPFENEEDSDIYDQPTQRYVKGKNKVADDESEDESDIYNQPTQKYVKGRNCAQDEASLAACIEPTGEIPAGSPTRTTKRYVSKRLSSPAKKKPLQPPTNDDSDSSPGDFFSFDKKSPRAAANIHEAETQAGNGVGTVGAGMEQDIHEAETQAPVVRGQNTKRGIHEAETQLPRESRACWEEIDWDNAATQVRGDDGSVRASGGANSRTKTEAGDKWAAVSVRRRGRSNNVLFVSDTEAVIDIHNAETQAPEPKNKTDDIAAVDIHGADTQVSAGEETARGTKETLRGQFDIHSAETQVTVAGGRSLRRPAGSCKPGDPGIHDLETQAPARKPIASDSDSEQEILAPETQIPDEAVASPSRSAAAVIADSDDDETDMSDAETPDAVVTDEVGKLGNQPADSLTVDGVFNDATQAGTQASPGLPATDPVTRDGTPVPSFASALEMQSSGLNTSVSFQSALDEPVGDPDDTDDVRHKKLSTILEVSENNGNTSDGLESAEPETQPCDADLTRYNAVAEADSDSDNSYVLAETQVFLEELAAIPSAADSDGDQLSDVVTSNLEKLPASQESLSSAGAAKRVRRKRVPYSPAQSPLKKRRGSKTSVGEGAAGVDAAETKRCSVGRPRRKDLVIVDSDDSDREVGEIMGGRGAGGDADADGKLRAATRADVVSGVSRLLAVQPSQTPPPPEPAASTSTADQSPAAKGATLGRGAKARVSTAGRGRSRRGPGSQESERTDSPESEQTLTRPPSRRGRRLDLAADSLGSDVGDSTPSRATQSAASSQESTRSESQPVRASPRRLKQLSQTDGAPAEKTSDVDPRSTNTEKPKTGIPGASSKAVSTSKTESQISTRSPTRRGQKLDVTRTSRQDAVVPAANADKRKRGAVRQATNDDEMPDTKTTKAPKSIAAAGQQSAGVPDRKRRRNDAETGSSSADLQDGSRAHNTRRGNSRASVNPRAESDSPEKTNARGRRGRAANSAETSSVLDPAVSVKPSVGRKANQIGSPAVETTPVAKRFKTAKSEVVKPAESAPLDGGVTTSLPSVAKPAGKSRATPGTPAESPGSAAAPNRGKRRGRPAADDATPPPPKKPTAKGSVAAAAPEAQKLTTRRGQSNIDQFFWPESKETAAKASKVRSPAKTSSVEEAESVLPKRGRKRRPEADDEVEVVKVLPGRKKAEAAEVGKAAAPPEEQVRKRGRRPGSKPAAAAAKAEAAATKAEAAAANADAAAVKADAAAAKADAAAAKAEAAATRGKKAVKDKGVDVTAPRKSSRNSLGNDGGTPRVLFTLFNDDDQWEIVNRLGGSVADSVDSCTVLVTEQVRRTCKFLSCLGRGIPIVSPDWLAECRKQGAFLDPWDFILTDEVREKAFKFWLNASLAAARAGPPLLEGYSVMVTPSVRPPPAEMKVILESCGARCLSRVPKQWPTQSLVVTCAKDERLWKRWDGATRFVSEEFVLSGVLHQSLNMEANVLKHAHD